MNGPVEARLAAIAGPGGGELVPRGAKVRDAYGGLNQVLTVMGIERKACGLVAMFSVVLFAALDSLLFGAVVFAGLWSVVWLAMKHDPRFMEMFRDAVKRPGGWYDPARLPETPWAMEVRSEAGREAER